MLAADGNPEIIARRPGVQRLPNSKLTLFTKKAFLTPEECAGLVARIERDRRPSTIADSNGDHYYRTSETCDLDRHDPFVETIDRKIAEFIGIDPAYGEPIQGQRYAVGQEFKAHTDYFEPQGADYATYCGISGNRTWTCMVYLNEPEAGGATRFLKVNKIVQPETGKLMAWNNRDADGTPNPASVHHGMKVRGGVKYVITKWYRERVWTV